MPRMLRRAAVLGATAHVASNRGAARAQAQQQEAQAAPEPAAPAVPAQAAAPEEAVAAEDPYADLMKLKELLDAGALTQAEFDAQKQKILNG